MDTTRFDAIARHLAEPTARRAALKTLAATGLAVGLTKVGLRPILTDAKKRKKKGPKKPLGERCKKSKTCANGLSCQIANSHVGCFPDSEKRCCKPIGARCDDGCECCGTNVICNGHYCQQS
jgi:hypothetical protein